MFTLVSLLVLAVLSGSLSAVASVLAPKCVSCRHFIPGLRPELGKCGAFRSQVGEWTLPEFAVHSRNNEFQCGKSGYLYENIPTKPKPEKENPEEEKAFESALFGEMKRYNTRHVYTPKELYQLLKHRL